MPGHLQVRVKEIFEENASSHGFCDRSTGDQSRSCAYFLFLHGIARVVGMLKSICASFIYKLHPKVKKQLWVGEFWEDGYSVRTVGDKVTAIIIRRYIENHRKHEASPVQ